METISRSDLYTLFAVVVLGASGIYLLLPHRHGRIKSRMAHQVGLGLSTLASLLFLLFLKSGAFGDILTKGFFYAFAFGSIGCAILTITSRDPIHSALWFAAVVIATSGLFLLSGAQFLAAGTVIVYAGAIIVTFLFVIMLAQKEGRAIYDRMARTPFVATLTSMLLLFGLVFSVFIVRSDQARKPTEASTGFRTGVRLVPATERARFADENHGLDRSVVYAQAIPETSKLPEATGRPAMGSHVASLGATLYTEHLVTVELAGALLFVALIGALAIATPKMPTRPATSAGRIIDANASRSEVPVG